MTKALLIVAVLTVLASGCVRPLGGEAVAPDAPGDGLSALVIVHANGVDVDLDTPWGTGKPWTRQLTGLVVPGHRILVVGWGLRKLANVEIQKIGSQGRTPARVVLIDSDAPLALFTVDDEAFWGDLRPAVIARELPLPGSGKILRAAADGLRADASFGNVIGYSLCGRFHFVCLRISQTDRSGASAVVSVKGQVVGAVAFTGNDELLAVSSLNILDFLDAASRAPYRENALLGVEWQTLSNPALRAELGLRADDQGVRVVRVMSQGSSRGVLEPGDVVLTAAGLPVRSDGTVGPPGTARLGFPGLFSHHRRSGDVVDVDILRGGQRKTVSVVLKSAPTDQDLVPWFTPVSEIPYAVRGGLVFEYLTQEYLMTFGKDWETKAPLQLVEPYEFSRMDPTPERRHLVVLTRVLPMPATLGYEKIRNLVVDTINEVPIRALNDVDAAFARPLGGFDVITFAPGQGVRRIVLDAQEAQDGDARFREMVH
jgi:PDZ domain-containing protein